MTCAAAKMMLFTLRKDRVPPGRDDKALTAWNGMMLAAFAEAGRVLDREEYRQVAADNARFLLQRYVERRRAALPHLSKTGRRRSTATWKITPM